MANHDRASGRRRVLVVSPPTFGRSVGAAAKDIFETVDLLQDMGHTVSFYGISSPGQDEMLVKEFALTHAVPVHMFVPGMDRWLHWLSFVLFKSFGYVDRASYVFGQLINDAAFKEHVRAVRPDVILFFCSYGWPVAEFAAREGIPCIFRSHNYEPDFFWESLSGLESAYPTNWVRYIAKVIGERNAVMSSNAVASLPFEGMRHYRKWKRDSVFIFTLTFPRHALHTAWVHREKKPIDVFYLGASYLVSFHVRGAVELIERIAPEVERRAPGEFVFHICGSKLPEPLQKKCDGSVLIYEGYVPDLDAFLERMDVGAFPVYTGKVMKGKVFESLARAFPIVIPSNCLGGYALRDKEEVLMAETSLEFVEAILSLSDDTFRERLSDGASRFAVEHFSKDRLVSVLEEIFSRVI